MSELTGKRLEIALAISEVTTMTVEEADRMAEKMVRGLDRFVGLDDDTEDCPDCDGRGVVRGEDRLLLCSRCDATGEVGVGHE